MTYTLKANSEPLIEEALELGGSCGRVYLFLWKTSGMSACKKPYNISNFTVKGIAGETSLSRNTVARSIGKLLDAGLITIIGEKCHHLGSNSTVLGVTHPEWLPHVKYSIEMMGVKPSARLKKMREKAKKPNFDHLPEEWHDDSWLTNHICKFKDPVKPFTEAQMKSIQKCLRFQSGTQS